MKYQKNENKLKIIEKEVYQPILSVDIGLFDLGVIVGNLKDEKCPHQKRIKDSIAEQVRKYREE